MCSPGGPHLVRHPASADGLVELDGGGAAGGLLPGGLPRDRDPPWNDLAFSRAHLAPPLHAHDTTLRRIARDAVVDVEQQHAKRRLVARAGRFLRYAVWRAP